MPNRPPARLAAALAAVLLSALTACNPNANTTLASAPLGPVPGWTYTPHRPTHLLFLSNRPGGARDGNFDIYHANLNGSNVRQLTDLPDASIRWFDKDPAGERLVIAYSTDGDLTIGPSGNHGGAEGGEQAIALMPFGGRPHNLIDTRDGGHNPNGFTGVWHPTFSPDGTRIAFSGTLPGESANLYVMDADGSNITRVFNDPHRTHNDPRFTPDGRIVFVRHDHSGLGQLLNANHLDVWIVDPDNPASAARVTREDLIPGGPRLETDPAMSPDGRWVAAIRATNGVSLATALRPVSDNAAYPVEPEPDTPIRTLQRGTNPDRVHGVPTWITPDALLSYRWEPDADGWRIIRFRFNAPDAQVRLYDLGAPDGSQDLMPLAY